MAVREKCRTQSGGLGFEGSWFSFYGFKFLGFMFSGQRKVLRPEVKNTFVVSRARMGGPRTPPLLCGPLWRDPKAHDTCFLGSVRGRGSGGGEGSTWTMPLRPNAALANYVDYNFQNIFKIIIIIFVSILMIKLSLSVQLLFCYHYTN